MLGQNKVKDFNFNPKLEVMIKQPVFSFNKFPNVNKQLARNESLGKYIIY